MSIQNELMHYGILGMKWGIRRYQDPSGNYTSAGKARYLKDKTKGIQKDIDSFKGFKNGVKDKTGRQILTKKDVEDSVAGLQSIKSKKEAKLSRKWEMHKTTDIINRTSTNAEKFVFNAATRKLAAKYVVDHNMPMSDAVKKAKGVAVRNTAIYTAAMSAITVASLLVDRG